MRLGLGNSLSRMGMRFGSAAAPEAAYVAALTAAGATVIAPQQAAISSFMSGEIAAGRWDGIKRFYFPVWGLAAANAICMKSLATGTWTGGAVTHAAGYVVSSLAGGYMDTNTTLGSLGINTSSYHFAVILKTSPYGGDNYGDCSYGISNMYPEADDGSDNYYMPRSPSGNVEIGTVYKAGVFTVGGNQSSRYFKNRDSSALVTILDNLLFTENFTNHNVFFMRANGAGRGPQSSSTQTAAFSIATALTDAQDTAYTLNLQNLYNRIRFGIITGLDWQNYADETIAYVIELNKAGVAYV